MGDHLVLYVDRLITASTFESANTANITSTPSNHVKQDGVNSVNSPSSHFQHGLSSCQGSTSKKIDSSGGEKGEFVECRICQEEDEDRRMEIPCACSGSMKYAHRKCVQRWCNEKGDTTCEICQQTYKHGYTAPQRLHSGGIAIDISGNWGSQLDLDDPRVIAMAAAEHRLLEAEYDEYTAGNSSGAACCRSAALIFMALLLLRHALAIASAGGDEDVSTFFTLLLRTAGFLLPCYIMARAMNIIQNRRQRQEAVMTAAEVAFLMQARRARGLRFAGVASAS